MVRLLKNNLQYSTLAIIKNILLIFLMCYDVYTRATIIASGRYEKQH